MIETYDDALRYMYALQKFGIKFGLRNVSLLLKKLGNPQKNFPSFIISGSNGKGATAAFLASMLKEHGLKAGLFMSPHLVRFTERIIVNGCEIEKDKVVQYTKIVKSALDELSSKRSKEKVIKITFFEFVTALAAKYFADMGVDVCVFEVGMGGRLDATNSMGSKIAIILTVSLEHTEYLGDTVKRIAREKAGIIKKGSKVAIGTLDKEAEKVVTNFASRMKAELKKYGSDFYIEHKAKHRYVGQNHRLNIERLGLLGEHQWINAACALGALEFAEELNWLKIDHQAVRKGLANAKLDGRFQFVDGNPPFLLDGAHNPQAMNTFISNLKGLNLKKPITAVFGIAKDKNIAEVVSQLSRTEPAHLIITKAKTPFAADPFAIAEHAQGKFLNVFITESVHEAMTLAKKICSADGLILVTGSFYVVGEALHFIFPSIESDKKIPWGRG